MGSRLQLFSMHYPKNKTQPQLASALAATSDISEALSHREYYN